MTAQPFLLFEDFKCTRPLTKSRRLAAEILRDRERRPTSGHKVVDCLACGRRTLDQGDDHCSDRCREWTARGEPPYSEHSRFDPFAFKAWRVIAGADPGPLPRAMGMGKHGFFIPCPGCNREFESKGLRCCSTECERDHAAALKRGPEKPGLVCLGCGLPIIPKRGGHRVRGDRQFHDDKCRKRHGRHQTKAPPFLSALGGKKSNEIKAKFWPRNLIGGCRVEGETEIEPGLRKTVIATEVFGNRRGKSE